MTHDCPGQDELLRYSGGELSSSRADRLAEHVAQCQRCRREVAQWQQLQHGIAAELPGLDPDRVAAAVMGQLGGGIAVEPSPPRLRWLSWFAAPIGVAALAGVAFVMVWGSNPESSSEEFASRGASAKSELRRKVGVDILALRHDELVKLTPGARLATSEAVSVAYVNGVNERPVYLLAFVVDADRELHWLAPGYTVPGSDPVSIRLRATTRQVVLPEAVVLASPAIGRAQLVWVASFEPLRVSSLESLPRSQRTVRAVRGLWPDVEVGAVAVEISR